jgi:glycosyltransferase involved in cell wall biosynthesis/SAM-dependent methyltransferase
MDDKNFYDRYYYLTSCGVRYDDTKKWELFFGDIADEIIRKVNPKTVLDAGCAYGYLVAALRDRGVEAYGIDISEYAISQVRDDIKPFCKVGSVTDPLSMNYDLIICIEVMEHLPVQQGALAIKNLCRYTDDFIFTSTPTDFKEATHFNVQPTEYWIKQFAECSFFRDIDFDATFIITHAIRLRKVKEGDLSVIGDYEKAYYRYSTENQTLREELVKSRSVIAERFNENESHLLAEKNHLNQEKDFRIAQLTNAFHDKENLLNQLNEEATAKEQLIRQLQTISSEKESFNRDLKDALHSLDIAHLKKTEEQSAMLANIILEKDKQIENLNAEHVKYLEEHINQLKKIVQENDLEFKKHNQHVEEFSRRIFSLDKILDEKNRLEHNFNELLEINQELKDRIKTLFQVKEEKESVISGLHLEIQNLNRTHSNLLIPYKSSFAELERIRQLKGYKLLWQFYKVRDKLLQRGLPVRPTENAGPSGTAPLTIPSVVDIETETILERERKYFSKNPLYHIDFAYNPLISIIVPIYNTPTDVLEEMIKSVTYQTYTHFELHLLDASPQNPSITTCINKYVFKDPRIFYKKIENNGIAGNTNAGIGLAKGEFVAFLDHDDVIAPNSLFEAVSRLQDDQQAYDFFYSDKDTMYEAGKTAFNPLYKPEWSPEMMLSANYLTHFCIVRKKLIVEAGLLDSTTDGAQDWDIYLKISRLTNKFCRIPCKLYHWRAISTSVASGIGAKPYALEAQLTSLRNHFAALDYKATPVFFNREASTIRIDWHDTGVKLVSFVVTHNSSSSSLQKLLGQISKFSTAYGFPTEVFLLASGDAEVDTKGFHESVKIVHSDSDNFYEDINGIAATALGEILVVLDSQISFAHDHSINEMVTWAAQEQYGFITPKITDIQNTILSAGIVLNGNFILDIFKGVTWTDIVIFGGTEWYRNVTAVRSNCFAIKTSLLKSKGSFRTEYHEYALIEFALRLLKDGYRHVYNPFAVAFAKNLPDLNGAKNRQPFTEIGKLYAIKDCDPYWNPNFLANVGLPTENLRKANISVARPVPRSVIAGWETEAFQLSTRFDFSQADISKNLEIFNSNKGNMNIETVNWILPHFDFIYYAGIYTIFRFANFMQSVKGVQNTFIIAEGISDAKTVYAKIVEAFPLLKDCKVVCISNMAEIKKIPYADASICSFWTTAYYLLRFTETKRKFYFIQDYEPLFYPAGSTYGQTETTYKFGFYGITNTQGLRNIYEKQYNAIATALKPCIDGNIFHARNRGRVSKDVQRVFFYGRPGHTRNGFELGSVALKILKSRLKNKVEIYCAGSDWDPADYGLADTVTNLGRMDFEKTGDLYRICDVGLIMMFTKHPSYLPFELMACGCAVVSNYNNDTSWFLKEDINCLLTEASATRIAETIEKLLLDEDLRSRLTLNALKDIQENHAEWDTELDSIYRFMCSPDEPEKTGKR